MSAIGRRVSKLSGYALAIPTPFDDAGTVDGAGLEQFWRSSDQAAGHCTGGLQYKVKRPRGRLPALACSYANTSRL